MKFTLDFALISSLVFRPWWWKEPSLQIHLSSTVFNLLQILQRHLAPPWCPAPLNSSSEVVMESTRVHLRWERALLYPGQPSWKCLCWSCSCPGSLGPSCTNICCAAHIYELTEFIDDGVHKPSVLVPLWGQQVNVPTVDCEAPLEVEWENCWGLFHVRANFALVFLTETVAMLGPIVSASRSGLLIIRIVINSVGVLTGGAGGSLNCRRDQFRQILVSLCATNEVLSMTYWPIYDILT